MLIYNKNQKIYDETNYINEIFSNFNHNDYQKNIDNSKLIKNNEELLDNENTIINEGNYCYIISLLQLLKNCKLFFKRFNKL